MARYRSFLRKPFAPQAGVYGAFQFHENRDAIARDEQVVERPAAECIGRVGDWLFAADQQEWAVSVADQLGVAGYEGLHEVFAGGGAGGHAREGAVEGRVGCHLVVRKELGGCARFHAARHRWWWLGIDELAPIPSWQIERLVRFALKYIKCRNECAQDILSW